LAEGEFGSGVFCESVVALDDVLEQAGRWLFAALGDDHVVQDSADCQESFGRFTKVVETFIIQQYFLDDERCDSLRQFGSSLHDSQAERDDFGLKQKTNYVGIINFHEGTDYAQGSQPQVLETTAF